MMRQKELTLNPVRLLSTGGILRDRTFYKTLFSLSVPIMLQNLLASSLSFVDTLMIGQLGEVEIAAVGLANQMFFLVLLLFFAIGSGSSIFFSQFWGKKDLKSIHGTLGLALLFGLAGSVIISGISIMLPRGIMRVFSTDRAVIDTGASYLRIVGISYLFSAVTFIYSSALRSTGNTRLPLLVASISMTTNAIFNYLLIFGKLGFPEMGVEGAAYATAGSRMLETVLVVSLSYLLRKPTAAPIRNLFGFSRSFAATFMKTVFPVILNEVSWSLGMVMYKVVFARMGTDVIASANVTESIQSLFFIVFIGTGNGTAIMIGNRIGQKRQDLAKRYASGQLVFGTFMGILLGLLMILLSPVIPRAFNISPDIITMTSRSLVMLGLIFPIKVFSIHSIIGVLRSGGDTRFSFIAEMTGVWCIGVPIAVVGGLVLHIPIYYLYIMVGVEEVYKMIVCSKRILSGKWVHDLTNTSSE